MKFQPLGDRVLIRREESKSTTGGGIIIPDTAKEKPSEGIVEAIAPNTHPISVGDKVLFEHFAGTEIHVGGQKCLLLNLDNILGIISENTSGTTAEFTVEIK